MHHSGCTVNRKASFLLGNHKAGVSLAAVEKKKPVLLLSLKIPPHTSLKLQSLDVVVYVPFKKVYARAIHAWIRSNPGRTGSFYDVPEIVNKTHVCVCVSRNILADFQSNGILPFNR